MTMFRTLAVAATLSLAACGSAQAERAVPLPAAAQDVPPGTGTQVAVLAGGCFWGMEAVFEQLKGVRSVTSGYAGGTRATANYADVSSETTRHAEAVRIVYDPRVVSYATLLRVYFSIAHDPTQLNRQGPDQGTSYRSAIFPQSPQQRAVAASCCQRPAGCALAAGTAAGGAAAARDGSVRLRRGAGVCAAPAAGRALAARTYPDEALEGR